MNSLQSNVILRADGSPATGLGHIHRMLALAKVLRPFFLCTFVTRSKWRFLEESLGALGVNKVELEHESLDEDLLPLLNGDEIVVLDGYHFDESFQKRIKATGASLVCVDDHAVGPFLSDAVINHCPGIDVRQFYGKGLGTRFFLGTRYALIDPPPTFEKPLASKSVLISMGGSDPANVTCDILETCSEIMAEFDKIIVVVGPGYQHEGKLEQISRQYKHIDVLSGLTKEEFYQVMGACSHAILSASTVAMEFATIGGTLALIKTADNQELLYRGMLSLGCATTVQGLKEIDGEELHRNQQKWFDGQSGDRLVRLFQELARTKRIVLSEAEVSHVEVTFEWACNPEIRKYSFTRGRISRDEHQNWFVRKVEDPNCLYLVGSIDGEYFGSVRFDVTDGRALISYLIDPRFEGQALGRSLLAIGMQRLGRKFPQVTLVEGHVLPNNEASIRNFERLAFVREDLGDRIRFYSVTNPSRQPLASIATII